MLLTTGIGAVWFVGIDLVLIAGIEITSKAQVVMSSIELLILFTISLAAFLRTAIGHAINPFSWAWFGLHYPRGTFASSALIVVFLYWGWDVTANLSEETRNDRPNTAGNGGFLSVFVTVAAFVAFTTATLMLFSLRDASGFSDNLIYRVAIAAGPGKAGGYAAALALITLGIYAISTFNTTTRIVGIGGLIGGILFFRRRGYRRVAAAVSVS